MTIEKTQNADFPALLRESIDEAIEGQPNAGKRTVDCLSMFALAEWSRLPFTEAEKRHLKTGCSYCENGLRLVFKEECPNPGAIFRLSEEGGGSSIVAAAADHVSGCESCWEALTEEWKETNTAPSPYALASGKLAGAVKHYLRQLENQHSGVREERPAFPWLKSLQEIVASTKAFWPWAVAVLDARQLGMIPAFAASVGPSMRAVGESSGVVRRSGDATHIMAVSTDPGLAAVLTHANGEVWDLIWATKDPVKPNCKVNARLVFKDGTDTTVGVPTGSDGRAYAALRGIVNGRTIVSLLVSFA